MVAWFGAFFMCIASRNYSIAMHDLFNFFPNIDSNSTSWKNLSQPIRRNWLISYTAITRSSHKTFQSPDVISAVNISGSGTIKVLLS
jgi:hypothetical protein